jgi:2-iminobutanoate/2-iminopropanoate deaminase
MKLIVALFFASQLFGDPIPKPIGPYSHSVAAGPFVFVSGQIPIDPVTNKLAGDTIESQTTQVIDNLEAILKAQGLTLANVVKTEVFLKHITDLKKMNEIYGKRFQDENKPARQAVQVSRLPQDALIEISCIAYQTPR